MTNAYPTCCTAAVFDKPNDPLGLRKLNLPKSLANGEMLVQVTCCTLCGSDLHTHSGRRTGPAPCVLGHEIVGTVVALGDGPPSDLRGVRAEIGDRMIWSVAAACHACRNCRRGIPQKCERLRKYGHHAIETDWQLSGGLAEYCHLVRGTDFVVIHDNIGDEIICPASCATSTVAAALRRVGDSSGATTPTTSLHGQRVLVLGAGMLGLTAAAMAKSYGSESVAVCDVDPGRLQMAEAFGADQSILFDQITGEFDVLLEMSGSPAAMQAALERSAIGGKVAWVGAVFPTDAVMVDPERLVRRLQSIHGVHNYAPQDLVAAVDFLSDRVNPYPFEQLIERSFALNQVNEALEYANIAKPIRIAVRP